MNNKWKKLGISIVCIVALGGVIGYATFNDKPVEKTVTSQSTNEEEFVIEKAKEPQQKKKKVIAEAKEDTSGSTFDVLEANKSKSDALSLAPKATKKTLDRAPIQAVLNSIDDQIKSNQEKASQPILVAATPSKKDSEKPIITDLSNDKKDETTEDVTPTKPITPTNPVNPEKPVNPVNPVKPIDPTDYANLANAIALGNNVDKDIYTPGTIVVLEAALSAGNAMIESNTATQNQVDAQTNLVLTALNNLVKRADNSELNTLIGTAQAKNEVIYTSDTIGQLTAALANAVGVSSDANATQQQVDAAKEALQSALDGLVEKEEPEKSLALLQQKISQLEGLNETDYTASSISNLKVALSVAKALVSQENVTEAQVTAQLSALNVAEGQLVKNDTEPTNEDAEDTDTATQVDENKDNSENGATSESSQSTVKVEAPVTNDEVTPNQSSVSEQKNSDKEVAAKEDVNTTSAEEVKDTTTDSSDVQSVSDSSQTQQTVEPVISSESDQTD